MESNRDTLEKLFKDQLERLSKRGCQKSIIRALQQNWSRVISLALDFSKTQGNIPFLPVIPLAWKGSFDQMNLIRYGRNKGQSDNVPDMHLDRIETPKWPYYIFDVDTGDATVGQQIWDIEQELKQTKARRGPVLQEIIALAIHTDVLKSHNLAALHSRIDCGTLMAIYCELGIPYLSLAHTMGISYKIGLPSCSILTR